MPVEEFVALNPAFNRPIIPASASARMVLPADKVEVFHANLEKYDSKALVSWQAYQPKPGEKLESVAKRFGVSVARLREVNGVTARTRGVPAMLVVPINGAATDTGPELPLMYTPPIPVAATRTQVHTVKAGESLLSIANHYKVTPDDLRRWNPIGRLTVGQRLRVQTAAPAHQASGRKAVAPQKHNVISSKKRSPPVKHKVAQARR
jgi:membrane-bound lytic murein transglycosylase D